MRRSAAVLAGLTAAALVGAAVPVAWAQEPSGDTRTWHAEQARVSGADDAGWGGAGVVVAVLDSWVDGGHPDLAGRVLPGADCLGGTCVAGPTGSDACDHGTHVAGTVAATSYGVAPQATVLPVRVLSYDPQTRECSGLPDDVAAGIDWAVEQGARIVNLSLGPDVPGLTASTSIPDAVRAASRAGVLVVFSAGNAGGPVGGGYGGQALVVAATGPSGALASYSQRGEGVDLAAPGGEPSSSDSCTRERCVLSLFPGGRYSVAAGTSMAAPHVSGAAALLLGQDAGRSREQVRDRLLTTARPLADAGSGLLDVRAALGVTASAPPETAAPATSRSARPTAAPATAGTPAPAVAPSAAAPTTPSPGPARPGSSPSTATPPSAAPTRTAVRPLPAVPVDAAPRDAADEDPGGAAALLAAALLGLAGAGAAYGRRLQQR